MNTGDKATFIPNKFLKPLCDYADFLRPFPTNPISAQIEAAGFGSFSIKVNLEIDLKLSAER